MPRPATTDPFPVTQRCFFFKQKNKRIPENRGLDLEMVRNGYSVLVWLEAYRSMYDLI